MAKFKFSHTKRDHQHLQFSRTWRDTTVEVHRWSNYSFHFGLPACDGHLRKANDFCVTDIFVRPMTRMVVFINARLNTTYWISRRQTKPHVDRGVHLMCICKVTNTVRVVVAVIGTHHRPSPPTPPVFPEPPVLGFSEHDSCRTCYMYYGHSAFACTMIIVHACTMIIGHVACPPGLLYDAIQMRVSKVGSPPRKSIGSHRAPQCLTFAITSSLPHLLQPSPTNEALTEVS